MAKRLPGVHEALGSAPNTEGRVIKSQAFGESETGK